MMLESMNANGSRDEILHVLSDMIQRKFSSQGEVISIPPEDPGLVRQHLKHYDFLQPRLLKELLLEVGDLLERDNLDTSHRRYMGLFNGPAHFSSVIADALVAAYNPQLSAWSHGAASIEIELHVIRFFLQQFGLSSDSSIGHFTSGGSESNMTALLCALNHKYPSFKSQGAISLGRRPLVYVSEYTHHSIQKAVCSIGLGMESVRVVPADNQLRMDVNRLQEMIHLDLSKSSQSPLCVVATAGTTSAGVVDPLKNIAELCRNQNLWFHVDAAWGGAAVFSERLKTHLAGIELADSITFDAHKWMAVSMGAGLLLCKDKKTVEDTFRVHADYMPGLVQGAMDLHKTSLQWSRRFIGLKVFLALAEKGKSGFQKQIDEQTEVGAALKKRLTHEKWVVENETPLPVICFTHSLIRDGVVTSGDVLKALYKRQKFWISETKIRNETVLRACITSPHTTSHDVEMLVQELEQIRKGLLTAKQES
jgi:glutamate/tyrosine decarboxylase-like PLP-dependent enzyme